LSVLPALKKNVSHKLFKVAIASFLILLVFQFLSGMILFFSHYGWSLSKLKNFYIAPNGTPFSISHQLEIATPHTLAMAVTIFILTHFFLFTTKQHRSWLFALWFFTFFNCFSGVLLTFLGKSFLWTKPIFFMGFQISFFMVSFYLATELLLRKKSL